MSASAWRRAGISALAAGLVTGTLGIAYGAAPVGLFGSVIAIAATVSVHPPDKPAED
jgi:hypothetical protein